MRYRCDRGLWNWRHCRFLYLHSANAPILTIWQHWFASDALESSRRTAISSALRPHGSRHRGAGLWKASRHSWRRVVIPEWVCHFSAGFWGDCRPCCTAVSNAVVAGGPLPSDLCSDGCLHQCTHAIVLTTTFGIGFFGDASLLLSISERILGAQANILAVSFCVFVLVALLPNDVCTKRLWRAARAARGADGIAAAVRKRSDRPCVSHSRLPLSANQSPHRRSPSRHSSIADHVGKSVRDTVPQVIADQVELRVQ